MKELLLCPALEGFYIFPDKYQHFTKSAAFHIILNFSIHFPWTHSCLFLTTTAPFSLGAEKRKKKTDVIFYRPFTSTASGKASRGGIFPPFPPNPTPYPYFPHLLHSTVIYLLSKNLYCAEDIMMMMMMMTMMTMMMTTTMMMMMMMMVMMMMMKMMMMMMMMIERVSSPSLTPPPPHLKLRSVVFVLRSFSLLQSSTILSAD